MSKFKVTKPINAHTVNAQYLPKWKDCQAVKQPIGCSVEAVATMIGCLPTQALAFSAVSIQTQRTQRKQCKRLRLDGNRASVSVELAVVDDVTLAAERRIQDQDSSPYRPCWRPT